MTHGSQASAPLGRDKKQNVKGDVVHQLAAAEVQTKSAEAELMAMLDEEAELIVENCSFGIRVPTPLEGEKYKKDVKASPPATAAQGATFLAAIDRAAKQAAQSGVSC